jgi:RHS repeat-associated protein
MRIIATKQYDYLNRLLAVSSAPSGSGQFPVSFNYAYNMANQRTRAGLNDSSGWTYEYDDLGQVTSGKRSWSDGTMVPGEQFQYTFDNIGNRIATLAGGDQNGGSLRSATYTANNLNEYSSRTVPGASDIIGAADVNGTVTVNGQSTYRHGQYYQTALTLTNGSGAIWQSVTNAVTDGTTNSVTGNIFLPPSTENFTYDLDGNLKSDGRWTNTWDAENRLVTMQGLTSLPTGANKQLQFVYDWQGRRIQKIVSNWNGSSYVTQYTNRFLYDGWNLIAELNGANNSLIRSYTWGSDLSGSIQGAGGVGGLLTVKPASGDSLFAAYDGNGNVSALVDATTGTNAAQCVYGPFGELLQISPTGTNNPNPIRFTTKYCDDEIDILYFGYRYYIPNVGRWGNRDPIAEAGGLNVLEAAGNNTINRYDAVGLAVVESYIDVSLGESRHNWNAISVTFVLGNDGRICPNCKSGVIRMAQIAQSIPEVLPSNLLLNTGWVLDIQGKPPASYFGPSMPPPFYPFQTFGYRTATEADAPGISGAYFWKQFIFFWGVPIWGLTQNFESCGVCIESQGRYHVLGCAYWGQQVGGARHSSVWGLGRRKPVPPSPTFMKLFPGYY